MYLRRNLRDCEGNCLMDMDGDGVCDERGFWLYGSGCLQL